MNIRARHAALFTAALIAISLVAFYSKSPLVFFRFDGSIALIIPAIQRDWSVGGWDFTSNPLQGLGGFEFFQYNLLEPGGWLSERLRPSIAPVVAMTFYALELAVAIAWPAIRLGLRPLSVAVAITVGLLLALPYVYPSLGFNFLWGVPPYIVLILTNVAIILLFLDLGRGPRNADILRICVLATVGAYQLHFAPIFAPLSFAVVGFFGLVAVVGAESRRERAIKLASAAALTGLFAFLFGPMLYAMFGFTKSTFFWYEFYPRPGSWRDISYFVGDHSRWPAWIVFCVALAGAMHAAFSTAGAMRAFARGFLVFVGLEFAVVLAVQAGWKGPRFAYGDIFAYPLYCVFCAHALATLADMVIRRMAVIREHRRIWILALCALPWLVLLDLRPAPLQRPLVRNENPYVWPPGETPVSRFLSGELALKPGDVFRGRVASLAGTSFEAEWAHVPMITQHNYDILSLFYSGNDHRLYGLWYFGIPTLHEHNQFSSPFFHIVNARLLNAPGTKDVRSYEIQSIENDRVMALLGTRFLISDKALPGRAPALSHRLVEGRDLYVYPVPNANVAGYSVTEVRRAADGRKAIDLLADPSIDLRSVAVVTGPEDVPVLVAARSSSLVVKRGAYQVSAVSPGTSLLVLPIEYSHCLEVHLRSSGRTGPRLLRANLALAAVLFDGDLSGELRLRYGALSSECRFQDWRDAEALAIGDVRDWPASR